MKHYLIKTLFAGCMLALPFAGPAQSTYTGKYCRGVGDTGFLRLIDESFACFHPNPAVPNVSMLYKPEWDTFLESGGWNAWWIQNSYGLAYAATPFLAEPWFSVMQRSLDLLWNNQGDGKRAGRIDKPGQPANTSALYALVAPEGSLGDCAGPEEIIYKQGDGDFNRHDWFYEATAAGLVMQSEFLLASRDLKAIAEYLPKMEKACNFIERARDTTNNLFLVGPACNLLAPSYGGVKLADGTFGKGYLAGVSVTYLAALDRMLEIYRLTGDAEKTALFEHRQTITRESLRLLLTPAGYFVKSVEPGGIMHGVPGQEKYAYLEGVVNADAAALRVVDKDVAQSIYNQIAGFPEIRPFDFLLTNAPGLDDTYWSWGNTTGPGMEGINEFGCWVNGGAWTTVEGRAILMYYRLGKFDDVWRSAVRAMKWAKDFRMDQPFTQRGENTKNDWYDEGAWLHGDGVSVMADNFAVPAATIRGLFDYEYRADRLVLRPCIPGSVTQYTQLEPIRFGGKSIFLSCRNGGPRVKFFTVNGKRFKAGRGGTAELLFNQLPDEAVVEIFTTGGWDKTEFLPAYPEVPALVPEKTAAFKPEMLPDSLQRPYSILMEMSEASAQFNGAAIEKSFLSEALESFRSCGLRKQTDTGTGYFRPIDAARKESMNRLYARTAMAMYTGFALRMQRNATGDDPELLRMARFFNRLSARTH